MPKVVGTRERAHPVFYESIMRGDQKTVAAAGPYRQASASRHECRTCGAPRSSTASCDYCGRSHT